MLNKKIKKFMEDKGIKQTFLVKQLGISASSVSDLLNGYRNISAIEYFKICDALKVPLDYFKEGGE